jgi:hypothetical protein
VSSELAPVTTAGEEIRDRTVADRAARKAILKKNRQVRHGDTGKKLVPQPQAESAALEGDKAEAGSRLAQFEEVIRRGAECEFAMGEALEAIKVDRLFKNHAVTFTSYCEVRLKMSLQRAGQLIRAAAIRRIIRGTETEVSVSEGDCSIVPVNEAQCRPLSRLLKDEQGIILSWEKAVQIAGNQQPTAKQVDDAARFISPPKQRKPRPEPVVESLEKDGFSRNATTRPVAPELRDKVDAEWLTLRQRFTEGEFLAVVDVLDAKIAEFRAMPPHQIESESDV